jgi:hypothetical protein
VRTYRAERLGVVVVRVLRREVRLSATPSSVAVTWDARVVDTGRC